MPIPLYYIAPLDIVRMHQDYFANGCHMVWYDEAAQLVIVKVRHLEEADEEFWASQPGVRPLPHPLKEQSVKLDDEHVQKLGHHGLKQGHKIHDLIDRISHPDNQHGNKLMKLSVF